MAGTAAAREVRNAMLARRDAERAAFAKRFFKCGPGEYGEGDVFLGLRVPELRAIARRHRGLPIDAAAALLHSPEHEVRLVALLILVDAFRRGDEPARRRIFDLYLDNTRWINNWDLVDVTAEHIVGAWLFERSRARLDRLARSKDLWERRIAIISTFHFIRRNQFDDTMRIAGRLLHDPHDLIHKAVGWMLREVGKRDAARLREFLDAHAHEMPRTMLRYAIEKFGEGERKRYLGR